VQPTVFSCPHCATRLRIRDRSQLGRTIDCPDCKQPLQLGSDSLGRLSAVAITAPGEVFTGGPAAGWSRKMRSPTLIAWTSVSLAAAVILGVVLRGERASDSNPRPSTDEKEPPAKAEFVASSVAAQERSSPPAVEGRVDDPPIDVLLAADDPVPVEPPNETVAADNPAERAPIDVPIAEDVVRFDVATQLRQPIREFTQAKPVEVRKLLVQVAELSAVPIDASAVEIEPWRERLDRTVTLALKETSVGEILDAVVQQVELRMEIADGVIRVLPPEGVRQ